MAIATPPPTTSNAELIRWAFDRLNEHDVEPLKQFWDDETYERFPDRECRGADEIAQYFREVFAGVPDFHMEVRHVAEDGDDVYVQWHMTGTHLGSVQGVEGTGRRLAIDGIDHFTVRDGKVVSNFVVFDQMQWARAIGMMPPQDSAADRAVKAGFNLRTKAVRRLRSRG